MISGVMIVKLEEKVKLVPDYKPTTLLYFIDMNVILFGLHRFLAT